ncbi:hypothetical protein [Myxosarcina sp. GI1]|uniref:hypothetical protein n=1 Tax=Myxosarcina sp. GI1 TaxID=1541065 RepID=UPI000569BA66|nr:hypothetical protein [Myxosarcina sp. GI1]
MLFTYLSISGGYFLVLLLAIVADKEASINDLIHFKAAFTAALFWPIVMPVSLLELKAKAAHRAKQEAFDALPKPMTMSDGRIRYIKQVKTVAELEESEPLTSYCRF